MLDKETISNAVDKKYSNFASAVKNELSSKMANHEISATYAAEFDRIQSAKASYNEINSSKE